MYYILYTIYYILYTIYYILYTIYYILCTMYYVLYNILYSIYYILYSIYYILYTICHILHTIHYRIYTIYTTMVEADHSPGHRQLPWDSTGFSMGCWESACASPTERRTYRSQRVHRSSSSASVVKALRGYEHSERDRDCQWIPGRETLKQKEKIGF